MARTSRRRGDGNGRRLLRDEEEAWDVSQDVFVQLLRRHPESTRTMAVMHLVDGMMLSASREMKRRSS